MTVREKAFERLIMKESCNVIDELKEEYKETLKSLNKCIASDDDINEERVNEYSRISQKLLILNRTDINILMDIDHLKL